MSSVSQPDSSSERFIADVHAFATAGLSDNLSAYRMSEPGQLARVETNTNLPGGFPQIDIQGLGDSQLRTAQLSNRPAPTAGLEAGGLHQNQTINVDGRERKYHVYIPRSYNGTSPIPLVVALDGVHIGTNNSLNGMAYSNRLIEQAERYGFALLIPESLPQSVRMVLTGHGWNEPNGAVNFRDPQPWSDSQFIRSTMDRMFSSLNIDRQQVFAVGFSQGGLQIHELVSRTPGLFSAVASVHGTMLDSVGRTPEGTRFLAIHGEGDRALPYRGGLGWYNWVLANRNKGANDSRPHAQIGRYLDANRATLGSEERNDTQEFRIRSWRRGNESQAFVQEIFLNDTRWGHAWHGRGGEPTLNGAPAPASVLDANDRIFRQFFGLRPK